MPRFRIIILVFYFLILLLTGRTHAKAGIIYSWEASSGLTPDQTSPPWSLNDSASPEDPVLSGGLLTLSTSANSENMTYLQSGSILDTTSPFYIETRVRYVSGSTSAASRAPITVIFNTGGDFGNALFIDQDQVFFNTSNTTAGTKISVETDDTLHTYRIDYDGSGGLTLQYDGSQILTGSTFSQASFNGMVQRISWGELSTLTQGTSE